VQGSVRDAVFPRAERPQRGLRAPWASLLSVGWIAIGVSLVAIGAASRQIGKPTWWLGDAVPSAPTVLWIVPVLGPFAAVMAAHRSVRLALGASVLACLVTGVVGAVDLDASPGAARLQLVLAGAGVLLTVAASAGRPTRQVHDAHR